MSFVKKIADQPKGIVSQAINAGISLERVSKALDHKQLETRKKYASMSIEILRDIVDGVPNVHHLCTKKTGASD